MTNMIMMHEVYVAWLLLKCTRSACKLCYYVLTWWKWNVIFDWISIFVSNIMKPWLFFSQYVITLLAFLAVLHSCDLLHSHTLIDCMYMLMCCWLSCSATAAHWKIISQFLERHLAHSSFFSKNLSLWKIVNAGFATFCRLQHNTVL